DIVGLLPEHVAHRGFEHELTLSWIYERIEHAIGRGILDKPVHRLPPENQAIPIHFSMSLIETWKFQYNRGNRVSVPRKLWGEVDKILGLTRQQSRVSQAGTHGG
ncbi:MAG: hypothetical protein QGI83_09375, partial [Candidatus Latescibacteria bacterium]|nr:hypothetical protein [Candidatus Latescibacterota bacterium]